MNILTEEECGALLLVYGAPPPRGADVKAYGQYRRALEHVCPRLQREDGTASVADALASIGDYRGWYDRHRNRNNRDVIIEMSSAWALTAEKMMKIASRCDDVWTAIVLLHGCPVRTFDSNLYELRLILTKFREDIASQFPEFAALEDSRLFTVHRMYSGWYVNQQWEKSNETQNRSRSSAVDGEARN